MQTLAIAVIGATVLKVNTDINFKFYIMLKGDRTAQYTATVSAGLTRFKFDIAV